MVRAAVNISVTKGPLTVDIGVPLWLNVVVPKNLPNKEPIALGKYGTFPK